MAKHSGTPPPPPNHPAPAAAPLPKIEAPTGMFSPPPAHAPHETTQPLHSSVVADMQAKAHQNEKALAPLKFALDKAVASGTAAQLVNPEGVPQTTHQVVTAPAQAPPDAPAGSTDPVPVPPAAHVPAPPILLPPPVTEQARLQPAASNTDSPSRGVPKPILDPQKQISGGWGPEGGGFEAQYYALDGLELAALVREIWKGLDQELSKDLRFGIACCYPQVAARVTIEITGATPDAKINDVAFTVASRVLLLQGVKVDDQDTPADALRIEAGLSRPYKHVVKTPTGSFIVDVESPGLDPVDSGTDPEDPAA